MFNNHFISQCFLGFISFLSNFISALSGGGAGLIQLPALIFFGLPFSKALATHKVASVALGFGASVPHLKKNSLQIKYVSMILISGIPGVLLGAYTSSILTNNFSTTLLGFLTLFLSFYSIKQNKLGTSNQKIKINMILKVDIFDSFAGLRQMFLKVGRRSTSKKYDLERLALRAVDEAGELIPPRAVFYFYNRSGNISATLSDSPLKITRVQIIKK